MTNRLAAVALAATMLVSPVAARAGEAVRDDAHLFSAQTIAQLAAKDRELAAAAGGRQIAVVTVDSLDGKPVGQSAAAAAKAMHLRGAIIYVARSDRQLSISYGPETVRAFPPGVQRPIKQSLVSAFKAGDFDAGILAAFDSIATRMRATSATTREPVGPAQPAATPADQGFAIPMWVWILGGIVVLYIVFRALASRSAPAPPAPGQVPGQYPPSQYPPNYAPGIGGGFMSGLAGGALGGFLGSELANARRDAAGVPPAAASTPVDGGEASGGDDGGSWSDAGGGGDFGGGDSGGDLGGDSGSW